MQNVFSFLVGVGIPKNKPDGYKHSIRFANTIALIFTMFILLLLVIVLYEYGNKLGAKLVFISLIIPFLTYLLNYVGLNRLASYWIAFSIPIAVIFISIFTKMHNPVGMTGSYEYFDSRTVILVSAIIPLMIFPRAPIYKMILGLGPSCFLLLFYDQIHVFFNVGFDTFFHDPTGGYYIAGLMFDLSYFLAVIGILSLKKSNEGLLISNNLLIDDLNNKNKIQTKLLLRKQDLITQNKEVSDRLLNKQKLILKNQKELEDASNLIRLQKSELVFKNIELNSVVDERTRDLKKANEELVIQNNGLLQFSNAVSHNLRAPVASILGLVHLFEIEKDESQKKEMLLHIKDSSIALDGVISDLNKVVDIRNQLLHLKEDINLNEEVLKIRQLLKVSLDEIGARIETKLEIDSIFFIRSYIHSILYNLINNAIKYSRADSKNKIAVKSFELNNKMCITVADKGLGIDLLKFGNDLYKMHKRFHDHVDGKGLGLYLVKQQVEAMNGTIDVKSKLGVGTTFILEFPIPEEAHFQEYYSSSYATVAYDANLLASMLIWHKPPHSEEYREVLSANKEMFANYDAVNWLVDVRSVGIISEEDRNWFASTVIGEIINRGCKTMVVVKKEDDGKDFAYWQRMLDISTKSGVTFNMFFDYDRAIEYLREKKNS